MKLSVIKACSYLNLAHQLPLNKACSRQDIYPVLSWCTPAVLAKMKACCQVWGRVWNLGSAAFTVEYQLCPHLVFCTAAHGSRAIQRKSTFCALFCVPSEMSHDNPKTHLTNHHFARSSAGLPKNANLLLPWNTHHCPLKKSRHHCLTPLAHEHVSQSHLTGFIPQWLTFAGWCWH